MGSKNPAKVKPIQRYKVSVKVRAKDLKLLDECRLYEPWLEDNIRRARRTKKDGRFEITFDDEEQRDVLSALKACGQWAQQAGEEDKSIDFLVLHDIIIAFGMWKKVTYKLD